MRSTRLSSCLALATLTLIQTGLVLAQDAAPLAPEAAVPEEASVDAPRSVFALKGIHLGDSLEQAQALFPELSCMSHGGADSGAEACATYTTFADKPAQLVVRSLDGVVVYVETDELAHHEQVRTAMLGFRAKYGQPAKEGVQTFVGYQNSQIGRRSEPHAEWHEGTYVLRTIPNYSIIPSRKRSLGAVVLLDTQGHDIQWQLRAKGMSGVASDL